MSYEETKTTERYRDLAEAVVARAALDYMEYKQNLYHLKGTTSELVDKEIKELEGEIKRLVRFFNTSIYMQIIGVSADWIIETLDKEFEKWKIEQDKLLA